MDVDITGLRPAEIDEAFRRVGNGTSEREVLAYMARCRSENLRAQLDRLTEAEAPREVVSA